MVHRAADSRLLSNLLTHEKDYAKALHALLSPSQALAAYAAASTPPLSHALYHVSTAVASADDALSRYADAVDGCRENLKRIKELEEDVANVIRDREILVTRLIKASKSHKNLKSSPGQRDSLHLTLGVAPGVNSGSASSLSLSSAFSSPTQSLALGPAPISSKLSSAQAELQACEATLAAKERALRVGRIEALREGLGLRCRAMVECGWAWGELGKEALKALEALDAEAATSVGHGSTQDHDYVPFQAQNQSNGHQISPSQKQANRSSYIGEKPLPVPHEPPKQYQQQQHEPHQQPETHTYYIPPAHAISDSEPFPSSSHQRHSRHILTRRITEEDLLRRPEEDEDGGSSADEPEAEVRVVENPRFFASGEGVPTPAPAPASTPHHSPFRLGGHKRGGSTASFTGEPAPITPSPKKGLLGRRFSTSKRSPPKGGGGAHEGSPSSGGGFFGSLRGLFGSGSHHGHAAPGPTITPAFYESPVRSQTPEESSPSKGLFGLGKKGKGRERKWETRTEKNLRALEREPVRAGPATDAYATPSRPSFRGRGRVASDVGFGAGAAKTKVKVKEGGEALKREGSGGSSTGGGGGRKLRKSRSPGGTGPVRRKKSRSASVPPVSPSMVSAPISIQAPAAASGALFAGTDLEARHLSELERHAQSPHQPEHSAPSQQQQDPQAAPAPVKRQRSVRKPSPKEENANAGVRDGLILTVVGSANPITNAQLQHVNRRASLTHPPPHHDASGAGGLARGDSVRSAASAPNPSPGQKGKKQKRGSVGPDVQMHQGRSVLEPGRPMPSLLSIVGDARDNLAARGGSSQVHHPHPHQHQHHHHHHHMSQNQQPATSNIGNGTKAPHAHQAQTQVYPSTAKSAGGSVQPIMQMEVPKAPPRVGDVMRGRSAERTGNGSGSGLEVVRAPGSVLDQLSGGAIDGLPASASGSGREFTGGVGGGSGGEVKKETRPAKSPLRSALRNTSRTPSPMPAPHLHPNSQVPLSQTPSEPQVQPRPRPHSIHGSPTQVSGSGLGVPAGRVVPAASSSGAGPSQEQNGTGYHRVSMSSIDSGDDVFYEAEDGDGTQAMDVGSSSVPPPHDVPPPQPERAPTPEPEPEERRRRKSVRVSLNPTFSATPPAIEYEGDEDGAQHWASGSGSGWGNGNAVASGIGNGNGHAWGSGRGKAKETPDMWEDSSEEDVEYTRAKSLLSRFNGGRKDKGKGKAG